MADQPMFEGMPEPREGLWADYERPGLDPLRVLEVQLKVSGGEVYTAGDEIAEMMAPKLFVGAQMRLEIGVHITGISHKRDRKVDGLAIGMARAELTYLAPVEQGLAGHYIERAKRNGKAAEEFETAADAVSDALAEFLPAAMEAGIEIPASLRKAHDQMRLKLFALKEAQR